MFAHVTITQRPGQRKKVKNSNTAVLSKCDHLKLHIERVNK